MSDSWLEPAILSFVEDLIAERIKDREGYVSVVASADPAYPYFTVRWRGYSSGNTGTPPLATGKVSISFGEALSLFTSRNEIERLRSIMAAAADEIEEHWEAHCDEGGFGPINLVRRLRTGKGDYRKSGKWYDCAHCDAGYPDQECTCEKSSS